MSTDEYRRRIDEAAKSQHIYQPKYGGKDHSGYDTLMKYEVNYEREEAFVAGAQFVLDNPPPEVEALFEALDICHKSIKASLILQDIGNARVPRRSLQHSALKNEDGENLVRTLDVAKSALDAYKARLGKG